MGVPNTNAFSLQDVVDEVNPTTDDLLDCVSDAATSGYNSTYFSFPATSLLEFRDYVEPGLTSISTTIFTITTSSACSLGLTTTLYHTGSGTFPIVGSTVYFNNFATPANQATSKIFRASDNNVYTTNAGGVVTVKSVCIV